jgi:3-methyladenine DNA glycosylase AlkC
MRQYKMNRVENNESSNENALKHKFNRSLVNRIGEAILNVNPAFDLKSFKAKATKLEALEMKQRVLLIRDALHKYLPQDFSVALKVILESLDSKNLDGFDLWPYTEFVQEYGRGHLTLSLEALKVLTKLFTSEWAVRRFIILNEAETIDYLISCAMDDDVHVRRWASEGTRPRLPWGERLHGFVMDPAPALPILEILKFDPELYVRKSVANHLNDIAKDHPKLVVSILSRWQKEAGVKYQTKVDWIVRRSLRTLIKNGDEGALKLIGVSKSTRIEFNSFKLAKRRIKLGDRIEFAFEIQSCSKKAQKLVVDYILHFVKANKKTTPKVFKLKTINLEPNSRCLLSKKHHLKNITTREYYTGLHALEIQINGTIAGKLDWHLEV